MPSDLRPPRDSPAMHLNTHLDIDLVALEAEDEVTALVELVAPDLPANEPRARATVQVVLDRSGSMSGERLEAAREALLALVDRLAPTAGPRLRRCPAHAATSASRSPPPPPARIGTSTHRPYGEYGTRPPRRLPPWYRSRHTAHRCA